MNSFTAYHLSMRTRQKKYLRTFYLGVSSCMRNGLTFPQRHEISCNDYCFWILINVWGLAEPKKSRRIHFFLVLILKQANDDVIRKLKTDQMTPISHAFSEPGTAHQRKRSISQRLKKPPSVVTNIDPKFTANNPPSPATSTSSIASSPSQGSYPPMTPGGLGTHSRKPSELGAVERFKLNHMEPERRNIMPSRLRTSSVSSIGDGSGSENWGSPNGQGSQPETNTPPSSIHSIDLKKIPDPTDRAVTCLLAEDNPITAKIIETLLIRLGCRCVVVSDGSEAISVAMGDISKCHLQDSQSHLLTSRSEFDCILMDLHMPVCE